VRRAAVVVVAVALAFASVAGCASSPERAATATEPLPVVRRVAVDVGALFPAATSRTVVDLSAVKPALLSRVALEKGALAGTDGVDPWLARALFASLVGRGAVVVDESTGASARLVGVRFAQGEDELSVVVVKEDGDAFLVKNRVTREDESVCEADLKVKVAYVQLEAVLVDDAHRVVAEIAEVVAAGPSAPRVAVDVITDDDVCARLAALMLDELAPGESELQRAADTALTTAFETVAAPL